jgi:hypothetical protein
VSTKLFTALVLSILISEAALASPPPIVIQKILAQGVPSDALTRLLNFMDENKGKSFQQNTYICIDKDLDDVKPCDESKRVPSTRNILLQDPQQVAIIDYGAPSTEYRFFLINLLDGEVKRFYSSHGIGSGKSNYATKFSDIKNSRQTSLGIFMAREVYKGGYGNTLRMYGLQSSNAQAYTRDIVMHGAWYVSSKFITTKNPHTGQPYGRLGVSWGCPAVSLSVVENLIDILKEGGLIMHYHSALMDEAQSGQEVRLPSP